MNLTRDRIQSIGWLTVLLICLGATVALTLRVNAVKGQLRDTEKHIVYVERNIDFLETEFQTRSNQQQLKEINDVEFGYQAPKADQYIEGERQLAVLGTAPGPGAPEPIRYASADPVTGESGNPIMAMVSPVNGKSEAGADAAASDAEAAASKPADKSGKVGRDPERDQLAREAADLSRRLSQIKVADAGAGH